MSASVNHQQKQEPAKGASSKACVLFNCGAVVQTLGAMAVLNETDVDFLGLLGRHVRGDWGRVCPDDAQSNRDAVEAGNRIVSVYPVGRQDVWIITEADRSATTILLPSEY
ncbi:hypothetical protein VDR48_19730 [Xanthomonas campestris pv. campestris]|nr:hypothetical protein [Xanthomonas campestris pv. campestris]MEB1789607.1 hypothetical protein [Xanthomonas campestris pv. campestris]MEB1844488.1 hypothetical protein [Xanthomonas campestris pv. campestris]MEB1878249.1 hypothetical protein [Xanthomonas campestris pv. campestris]